MEVLAISPGDGCSTSQAAVWPVVVVEVQPWLQGLGAGLVRGENLAVSPANALSVITRFTGAPWAAMNAVARERNPRRWTLSHPDGLHEREPGVIVHGHMHVIETDPGMPLVVVSGGLVRIRPPAASGIRPRSRSRSLGTCARARNRGVSGRRRRSGCQV